MWLLNVRNRYFIIADTCLLACLPFLAYALRLESIDWTPYTLVLIGVALVGILVKLPIFWGFGLYNRYWRYASMDELLAILKAVAAAALVIGLLQLAAWVIDWPALQGFPRSFFIIDGLLTLVAVGSTRFSIRLLEYQRGRLGRQMQKRVLIVGAGDFGQLLARELHTNRRTDLQLVGFVDDDPAKQNMWTQGVPVLGPLVGLSTYIADYSVEEVIIALPSAPGKLIRQINSQCKRAGVAARTVPSLAELITGQVSMTRGRGIQIEDLLRREPVQVDPDSLIDMLRGNRILVTGAGGSIGSEICRQILLCGPTQLILLGHGENSLFQLSHELERLIGAMEARSQPMLTMVVADVRDQARMRAVFDRFRPQLVFHAAAHKQVPLMEANIEDAVTNNVQGTRTVVELSAEFEVERFVLISSDKAVNPVSIMGVTKRVAEVIVGRVARLSGRPYVSVRFGNVLGSRGSVVPLFREQIANGGPVTVTHPEMQRYFMTIPEAVQLVLQAAALSAQGDVFILDMAQPVKIVDLARDLIKLSGLQAGHDIDIVLTGLRPGEKLVEELFLDGEAYRRTSHEHIYAVRNGLDDHSDEQLMAQIDNLLLAAQQGQPEALRQWLKQVVPEFGAGSPERPTLLTNIITPTPAPNFVPKPSVPALPDEL